MGGILYHTKKNNQEIKKMLDNPITGREIVKKLMTSQRNTSEEESGNNESSFIVIQGDKIEVKEMGYDIKNKG